MPAERWAVCYLVVDTRNWVPSRKVLVRPREIADIDWEHRRVNVRLKREEVL